MFIHLTKKIAYFFTKGSLAWLGKRTLYRRLAITSDVWSYLDDDFHVEITNEVYHHCVAQVCDKSNADTEKFASVPTRKTDKGPTLRLPHRFQE